MTWLQFLAAMWPDLLALARVLYTRTGGNVAAAHDMITRIRNHGLELDAGRLEIDRRMEAARGEGER